MNQSVSSDVKVESAFSPLPYKAEDSLVSISFFQNTAYSNLLILRISPTFKKLFLKKVNTADLKTSIL